MKKLGFKLLVLLLIIPVQPGLTESIEISGNYYLSGNRLLEIYKEYDSDYRVKLNGTLENYHLEGDRLYIYPQYTPDYFEYIFLFDPDEKLVFTEVPQYGIITIGRKIDDDELWSGLTSFRFENYPVSESILKNYLDHQSEDHYIRVIYIQSLIENKNYQTALIESDKFKKYLENQKDELIPMELSYLDYIIEGTKKAGQNENIWLDYWEVIQKHRYPQGLPLYVYEQTLRLDREFLSLDSTDMELLKIYTQPNLSAIELFYAIPDRGNIYDLHIPYILSDLISMKSLGALNLGKSILYYGRYHLEEGDLNKALDGYAKLVRMGQKMIKNESTYQPYHLQLSGNIVRSIGYTGLSALFGENKINNISDAELVLDKIKELRRLDPISAKESIPTLEKKYLENQYEQFLTRAKVAETRLILLETAAAVKCYQLTHGFYPEKLDFLIPDYLSKIPMDTFGPYPVKIKSSDKGILLYSFGPDELDNHGLIEYNPLNGIISEGDVIIRVK